MSAAAPFLPGVRKLNPPEIKKPEAIAIMEQAALAMAKDRFEDAALLIEKAVEIDRFQKDLQVLVGYFDRNAPASIWEKAQGLAATGCRYGALSDMLALGATRLGHYDEVRRILDYDRFLQVRRLADLSADERSLLIGELVTDVTAYTEMPRRSPHYMLQRLNLRENDQSNPAIHRALARIRQFVAEYCQSLEAIDSVAPFVRHKPREFVIEAWSVISGENSYHTPHMHPRAWASGVYYVQVPAFVSHATDHAGWYRAGRTWDHRGFGPEQGWEHRWICPANDLILIGPSYFFHDTVPLGKNDVRIAIAYDVIWRD